MADLPTPLPCPFCGDTPDITKEGHFPESQGTKWGNLMCGCSAMGPEVRTGYRPWTEWRERAIEAWNTRTAGVKTCRLCRGQGRAGNETCPACSGTGTTGVKEGGSDAAAR